MTKPPSGSVPDSSAPTGIGPKLLNFFVSPSLVFDEVAVQPFRHVNWLVPTALVCLTSLLVLRVTRNPDHLTASIQQLLAAGSITQQQATALSSHWATLSAVATCLYPFLGVLWSACIIWFIGRVLLKSSLPFSKALEVAGLSQAILLLGTVTTGLLVLAAGDVLARPALSLLVMTLDPASRTRATLETLNVFYLWTTVVLVIGLSRLSRISVFESAFWVFSYWVLIRVALVLLS